MCHYVQGYVLLRLIKGLGSGRGGCRQGFAAALAAVLETVKGISNAEVNQLMEQHLPLMGSGKGTVRHLGSAFICSFSLHQDLARCRTVLMFLCVGIPCAV